ncbi:MAG: proline dehydrogenase family protein [Chitinophagales bacterium]|nr:proline dehydrogenase family protein [Chitinophagales bacterium]
MEVEKQTVSFENTEIAFIYKSNSELKRAWWLFSLMNNNLLVKIGTRITPKLFDIGLPIKGLVKPTIFSQFCGGETMDECAVTTKKLSDHGVETILDYGVEGKENEEEFDKTANEISKAIVFAGYNHHIPFVSIKVTGIVRFALLEKMHERNDLNENEMAEWQKAKDRFYSVCKTANENNVGLMVDAEETWIQDPVDELAMKMMAEFNKEKVVVYNTAQLYRTDRLAFVKRSIAEAKAGNFYLGFKLVRGAYMEKERKRAQELNYASPIQPDKDSSDKDYNAAVTVCMENIERVSICIASHNDSSNLLGVELAMKKGIASTHPHLNFSQLYGMSDNITFNLAHAGYNVSKYVPYGPVKDVVPYLMRRAQENTSVGGMSSRELMLINKELKRRKN